MADFKSLVSGETEPQFRQLVSALLTISSSPLMARTGVLGPSGLTVRQTTTASGSVTVDPGVAVAQDSVLNGAQPLVNNTAKTVDILGPDPVGGVPRNDIVVFDSATGTIRNIVGVPAAVPTDPTVPTSAVKLARLRHGAAATTVPVANIDDLRVFTSTRGGIVTARSQAERDTMAQDNTVVYRTDTKCIEVSTSSGWVTYAPAPAGGVRNIGQVPANGFVTWTVTFPAGQFSTAPRVTVTPSSGRLNMAVRGVTATGCTVEAYNASTVASAASGEFFTWVATPA